MGRFDSTKTAIDVNITQNGNQEITGSILKSVLNNMVDATDAQLDILQEAIPTKLSDLEQDIPIGSYDDTELRERIEENEVLIEDLQNTKIDKEADDYYPQLSVGLADNLSGVDVVDSEVNFRRSGGGAISDGVARIEAIKGNSVVWNQRFGNGATNKDYLKWEGNKATINGEFDADNVSYDIVGSGAKFVAPITNHKYLVEIDVISGTISGGIITHYLPFADKAMNISENQLSAKTFVTSTITPSYYFARTIRAGVIATNLKVMYRVTDLTKAFPNDWQNINTIEEFYARIPMGVDLNAYNEGEVIHMDVQSIESQGVNAWDEEWEKGSFDTTNGSNFTGYSQIRSVNLIPILPSMTYAVSQSIGKEGIWIMFYDKGGNVVEKPSHSISLNNAIKVNFGTTFNTPSNAAWMKFYTTTNYGSTYNNDISINLSDTSINGKYFPYIKRIEDLSIIRKYFPQGMKLAGSAYDEIRYNKATQKWEYSKGKIVGVKMKDLTWKVENAETCAYRAGGRPVAGANNLICSRYATSSLSSGVSSMEDMAIMSHASDKAFYVRDTRYTSVADFTASLTDNDIIYCLAADWEWVELDAEDQFKDLDYQVWNCGTEKAIAEGKSSALAADITYGFNAIGKIKELESLVAALRVKVGI